MGVLIAVAGANGARSLTQLRVCSSPKSAVPVLPMLILRAAVAALILLLPLMVRAEAGEGYAVHGQITWIEQLKPAFDAAYTGARSLSPERETSYSQTATLFLAWRLPAGIEFYADPEVARGIAFSGLYGIAAYPNGEEQKSAGSTPKLYRARLFLRRSWLLSDDRTPVEDGVHQLAGETSGRRLTATVGNYAINDLFGHVAVGNDPRTGFMSWAHMTYAAFDFAGDLRGYTWGAAVEYDDGPCAIRAGRFALPEFANQQQLDTAIGRHYFDVVEAERHVGEATRVAALAFRSRARMGTWSAALAAAAGAIPDVTRDRPERVKYGAAATIETDLQPGATAFVTGAWADGATEEYAFAEVDRSSSIGLVLDGRHWARPKDGLGAALAVNELSGHHRDYLAAGGLGGFVGDGRLTYGPEWSLEAWYRIAIGPVGLSFDVARITNPGYNRDRGPMQVLSVRLHAEF